MDYASFCTPFIPGARLVDFEVMQKSLNCGVTKLPVPLGIYTPSGCCCTSCNTMVMVVTADRDCIQLRPGRQ